MTPFGASLMSLDSSGITCAVAPAPVGQRMTINAGSSEPAHLEDHTVVREAVAVFHSAENLQNAIDEVLSSGFHRSSLSLLANEAEVIGCDGIVMGTQGRNAMGRVLMGDLVCSTYHYRVS